MFMIECSEVRENDKIILCFIQAMVVVLGTAILILATAMAMVRHSSRSSNKHSSIAMVSELGF